MAVTIEQSPSSLSTSDNDIVWVFSSDQTAQANFEFKVEVFIDGVSQGDEKVYPTDGTNAYFNASETVKPLFNTPQIPTDITSSSDLLVDALAHKEVYIVVTEVYGDPQADEADATSSTIDVIKASVSDDDFVGLDTSNYIVGTGTKDFLTNFGTEKYWVDSRKSNYVSFFLGSTKTIFVELRTYDISGTLIDTERQGFGSTTKGLYNLNVSKKEYPSLDFTDAYYYTVRLVNNGSSTIVYTNALTFYIHEPCTEDRTVYFLNKLGGLDSWLFNKKKQVDRKFTRESFKRTFGVLNGAVYEYSKFAGREINYLNYSESRIKLLSDWNNPDVQGWLVRELLESPLVWLEDSNDVKKRYMITNSREQEPEDRYVELVNLEIDLKDSLMSKSAIY